MTTTDSTAPTPSPPPSPPPRSPPVAPPPAPPTVWASPALAFRGRIFHPEVGYTPRSLLELRLRAGVGAILNKRDWWRKWTRDDGAIRARWFHEFESSLVAQTLDWSTREWTPYALDDAVVARFSTFPTSGTDDQKQAFVDQMCSKIPYNLIWNDDWWEELGDDAEEQDPDLEQKGLFSETQEQFQQGNARMESYGQLVWYYELVLLNNDVREMPLDAWQAPRNFELGTDEAIDRAAQLILAARRGDVTRNNFAEFAPDADLRSEIVDALWIHVDRIVLELEQIRQCMTKTLDKVIENNRLDAEIVTEFVSPGPVQETWLSDLTVEEPLKRIFVEQIAVLENVPEENKDWHPDSNHQVLDLVHPSLYCCVFGRTKAAAPLALLDGDAPVAQDDVISKLQRLSFNASDIVENPHRDGAKFQWIPSDFQVDTQSNVAILSYINNLHPVQHRGLYKSIAHIFREFLPMFDRVLSCLLNQDGPLPTMADTMDGERDINQIPHHPAIPEILRLHPPGTPFTLRGKKLQVIVKIAEIVVTPENPSYPGGSWHVEGSDAEQIVATGIYYFACENLTESKLSFRVIVSEPEYDQNDAVGMAAMYGLIGDERLVQSLGSVTAVEDRCVVFPNTLQHRVEPFELVDKTKPGVRKILAFFIIDPSKQIPSTATIPPQQADWIHTRQQALFHDLQTRLSLPKEVVDTTMTDLLGRGMTLEEAKSYRLKLMEERKPSLEEDDDYELFFSLCEH